MARKNIFQLVEENYNIQDEIKKINRLFTTYGYFKIGFSEHTFKKILENYLFEDWKYNDTCITIEEYLERVNAKLPANSRANDDRIINFLEVMENFIKLYFDNANSLYSEYQIQPFMSFSSTFYKLINTLEKRMGLTTREYKDKIIIYPKNAPLEKVIELTDDEDVQWELIRYVREDLSLSEKRKSLAYLATNLYIEEDSDEKDPRIKELINKAGNILNNLHIRHNNKTGKWENKILDGISEEEAITLCDMAYNEMLTIELLRDHKKYEQTYYEFNKKQREASKKKKAEGKSNGQA